MVRRSLSTRPIDLLYFCFFMIHIPASLVIDFQALYPQSLIPDLLKQLIPFYIKMSGDPLIASAFGYYSPRYTYVWFRSFLWLELLFQLPVFILGARGLWKDSPRVYLLLLIYGASTTTTLFPCLATVLAVPTAASATDALTAPTVTTVQRLMLLSSYVPFLVVPLAMTIDMAFRVSSMLDPKKLSRTDPASRIKREE